MPVSARAVSEAEALGGVIASISGPVMSVLFGAPQAHEDDPERALRSALRIIAAVGRAPGDDGHSFVVSGGSSAADGALSVRIGVETGAAVVGPVERGRLYGS